MYINRLCACYFYFFLNKTCPQVKVYGGSAVVSTGEPVPCTRGDCTTIFVDTCRTSSEWWETPAVTCTTGHLRRLRQSMGHHPQLCYVPCFNAHPCWLQFHLPNTQVNVVGFFESRFAVGFFLCCYRLRSE